MKKIFCLFIVSFVFLQNINAQSYQGFLTDNYAGIHGVINNPSSIVDSKFRTDINLISPSFGVTNDYYGISISDLFKNDFVFEDSAKKYPKSSNNFYTNLDVLGPSFMMNIAPNQSIALFTRGRVISHFTNLDGIYIEDINDDINNSYSIQKQDFSIASNAWIEFGGTYARVLKDDNEHFLKGGISLKYLLGLNTGYIKATDYSVAFQASGNGGTYTTTGNLESGNVSSLDNTDSGQIDNGVGAAADIGFTYEYRPSNSDSKSKYLYKVGFSITDIGFISYKDAEIRQFDASGVFSESQSNNDFETYYTLIDKSKNIVANMPTALHANIDWNFKDSFYLNLNTDLSLVKKLNPNSNFIANNVSITPRFEKKWISIYLPLTYMKYSGFQAGFGFRSGPFYVGSGSVISGLISDTKALDLYAGFKIPIYNGK